MHISGRRSELTQLVAPPPIIQLKTKRIKVWSGLIRFEAIFDGMLSWRWYNQSSYILGLLEKFFE
jgi:hypothetical protein